MSSSGDWGRSKVLPQCFCIAVALIVTGPVLSSGAHAEEANWPSFRKGLWHFVRTLDVARSTDKTAKYRLFQREMTRCVDPTLAMKATFSPAPVGSCVSDKPQKVANRYTFAHRCDYMGPVSTVITVKSNEAYTEVDKLSVGEDPRIDKVVAQRLGDCQDDGRQDFSPASVSGKQQ